MPEHHQSQGYPVPQISLSLRTKYVTFTAFGEGNEILEVTLKPGRSVDGEVFVACNTWGEAGVKGTARCDLLSDPSSPVLTKSRACVRQRFGDYSTSPAGTL